MKRAVLWVVFLLVLLGVFKAVAAYRNPWSPGYFAPASLVVPAPSPQAVYIPGCGDKQGCL